MRARIVLAFLLLLSPLSPGLSSAQAQAIQPKEKLGAPIREQLRQKMNENLLVLMCGSLGAPYIQLGHDISVVVKEGDNLRMLPVVSDGALTNVRDVVFLKGMDVGISTVAVRVLLGTMKAIRTNLACISP